ncbi:hypothetical protein BDI4_280055 [Burkholderia diffusa]|nr:hypothetical protein BDI4_280055 [Burkholderia diffusa]
MRTRFVISECRLDGAINFLASLSRGCSTLITAGTEELMVDLLTDVPVGWQACHLGEAS